MSTNPDTATADQPDAVDIEQFDENRQAELLTLQALKKLGLHPPINEPILCEAEPGARDYLIIIHVYLVLEGGTLTGFNPTRVRLKPGSSFWGGCYDAASTPRGFV